MWTKLYIYGVFYNLMHDPNALHTYGVQYGGATHRQQPPNVK